MGMRVLCLVVVACVAACGGSGGSDGGGPGSITGPGFEIAGSNPVPGGINVSVSAPISIFFNLPANLASVDGTTFHMETAAGVAVSSVVQRINNVQVRLVPNAPLVQNTVYRVVLSGDVRSAGGERLGADYVFTFVTDSTGPTLRPGQIVDLGERLLEGRFRARSLSINGVITVFGGYSDEQTVTDTVEIHDEATGMFRFANATMLEPRAEHTVTVMRDGRVLITGGISIVGGPPLATTEYFDPTTETFTPGPPLLEARRWHAASTLFGAEHLLVSGGFGASGAPLRSLERLVSGVWIPMGLLPMASAQHVQVNMGLDVTYIGVGNLQGIAAIFDGTQLSPHDEGVRRSRDAAIRLDDGRLLIASGDVRRVSICDAQVGFTYFASDLFFERRGEHTLASIGQDMFLAVGGFNVSVQGEPALDSCEIVEYLPGPVPDARVHYLFSPRLPVPFAGHVSEKLLDGSILLMGGVGAAGQPHSRRVVRILVD